MLGGGGGRASGKGGLQVRAGQVSAGLVSADLVRAGLVTCWSGSSAGSVSKRALRFRDIPECITCAETDPI